MKRLFKIKKDYDDDLEAGDEYVEIDTNSARSENNKVIVRPFHISEFGDVKAIVESLREGYTIALVNIKPLKEKDMVELKRAVNKLKKTCDAMEGDIAGFGDDYIVIVPNFAEIYRAGHDTTSIEDD